MRGEKARPCGKDRRVLEYTRSEPDHHPKCLGNRVYTDDCTLAGRCIRKQTFDKMLRQRDLSARQEHTGCSSVSVELQWYKFGMHKIGVPFRYIQTMRENRFIAYPHAQSRQGTVFADGDCNHKVFSFIWNWLRYHAIENTREGCLPDMVSFKCRCGVHTYYITAKRDIKRYTFTDIDVRDSKNRQEFRTMHTQYTDGTTYESVLVSTEGALVRKVSESVSKCKAFPLDDFVRVPPEFTELVQTAEKHLKKAEQELEITAHRMLSTVRVLNKRYHKRIHLAPFKLIVRRDLSTEQLDLDACTQCEFPARVIDGLPCRQATSSVIRRVVEAAKDRATFVYFPVRVIKVKDMSNDARCEVTGTFHANGLVVNKQKGTMTVVDPNGMTFENSTFFQSHFEGIANAMQLTYEPFVESCGFKHGKLCRYAVWLALFDMGDHSPRQFVRFVKDVLESRLQKVLKVRDTRTL